MSSYQVATGKSIQTSFWQIKSMEYIGKVYGLLTITEILPSKKRRIFVRCLCKCGKIHDSKLFSLKNGDTKSCGCYSHSGNFSRIHGDSHNSAGLYNVWKHIKSRCYNPKNKHFKDYGGRGITVCAEWLNSYPNFKQWALVNGYRKGLQIDREENNGVYEPNNCRFVTPIVNANNKRNNVFIEYKGEVKRLLDWVKQLGIPVDTLRYRLKASWGIDKTFTTPVRQGKYNQK